MMNDSTEHRKSTLHGPRHDRELVRFSTDKCVANPA